ncbi:alpha/beta hydrolase [Micrococcaceae bacterium Sec5.7]
MTAYAPSDGLRVHRDIPYSNPVPAGTRRARGAATSLDVYVPAKADALLPADGPLPVVVWIHGGAWISGTKSDVAPYLRLIAAHGYAAVGLNYSIAPECQYPTAVRQLNEALRYLVANAGDFNLDKDRIILAGDSAGAQLASQLAVMTTNPAYAVQVGITPAILATA